MKLGFENNKFYVEYTSPRRPIGNMRQELDYMVKEISDSSKDKLLLSLSSGLDSQVILHSLHQQQLPYQCAFLYHPGYNDSEYENLKILENKYGFKTVIIDIDPNKVKDEILEQAYAENQLPNNFMHKKFISLLPEDLDVLIGIEGPDFILGREKKRKFIMQAYNGFENTKLRTLRSAPRSGKVLTVDRDKNSDAFLASILNDSIVRGYVNSLRYIEENEVYTAKGVKVPVIWNWNIYIKPIIMGRYWREELEFFPKSMGVEKIDWIMDCPIKLDYEYNVAFVEYKELIEFLLQTEKETLRVFDHKSRN